MSNDATEVAGLPASSESELANQTEQNTPEATAADGVVEPKQVETPKTFSQAEVDALIQKRLLKEERRVHRRVEQQLREQAQREATAVAPKRESFEDDEAYRKAEVEHLAEKRAAEKLAEREKAQQQERVHESFLEKAEKARERYSDFDVVVGNPALQINESMVEFFGESDIGEEIAYHLGKNPTKAAQIAQMSPIKAARELTRIEAEIAAKPKATPSKAPDPINPVGSRGRASTSALPSDEDDIGTWMRKERERVKRG